MKVEKLIRTIKLMNQNGIELERVSMTDLYNFEEGDPSLEVMNKEIQKEAEKRASKYTENKVTFYICQ